MEHAPIDLFRPFMSPDAARMVAETLAPDAQGRLYIGEGPRVAEFEAAFTAWTKAPDPVLAVNSGTSALDLAAHLCNIGLGSEVISTPMTCSATNSPLATRGARIVWADVDPITGLIDPADVARKISPRTKAIMAVDWAGRSCNYAALHSVARNVPIIQDAAHHLGVDLSQPHGDYVCWSFQAIKHLTTGDGGAILAPAQEQRRARLLRWYGLDRQSSADFRCAQNIREVGWKYHMNDIAAAIGLANLPHAHWVIGRYRENAAWYGQVLQAAPGITPPPPDPGASWWLYTLLVEDRASFIAYLAERGIASSPVHRRNDVHTGFSYPSTPLPGVDAFSEHEVAIPVGYWVTEQDQERVARAVLSWSVAYARDKAPVAA